MLKAEVFFWYTPASNCIGTFNGSTKAPYIAVKNKHPVKIMEFLHIIAIVTLQGTCKCIILKMCQMYLKIILTLKM